jgi:hypothetical protein
VKIAGCGTRREDRPKTGGIKPPLQRKQESERPKRTDLKAGHYKGSEDYFGAGEL